MTKKYFSTLLLMIPALFFGNIVDFNIDNGMPEPLTIENSSSTVSPSNLEDDESPSQIVRSFKITDSDTAAESCFPTPGQGVIFQKLQCAPGLHLIWSAGGDLILNEYADDTAKITGTVIDQNGKVGVVNITLSDKSGQGTTWNKQCYLDGLSDTRYFYQSFSGTIDSEGVSYTIEVKDAAQHYIFADGASLDSGQFGFGAWTGGTFGECTEWFGDLTPIVCDIEVNAGDDVEVCTDENVELTANVTGTTECVTGCVYPVLDDNKCGGTSEEVWLRHPGQPASENRFFASVQNFETFDNGTARYTATASNGVDTVRVDMLYSGFTTTAPENSPKEHSCGAFQDLSTFGYYTSLNGTVVSENHGTFTAIADGPSFQIGIGADVQRPGFGASGWFLLSGGNGYYERGDINLPLGECDEQSNNALTYEWTTNNGAIVGNVDQQTIVVSESGTYMVTVTNCNGCEAIDTVDVNILEKLIIGDFVWDDVNNNGLQDADEPGIDGVTVSLFDANDNLVAETVTANGGEYVFEVCPGEYFVIFGDFPSGFGVTTPNAGDDTLDSDADADGRTPMFELTNENNPNIDCGLVTLCNLEATVSGDEEVCSGEEATLTASGGDTYLWSTGDTTASITVNPTATTTYTVVVSDSTVVDCSEELSITVNVTEKLIIGDFVWDDVNNNGLQDANEPGIDGVTVSLFDANDNLVAETVTANGGEYVFEVCPGEYFVVFGDFPTGFGVTTPNAGDDTLDSDADADGRTPMFEMTDTDNTTIDCGLVTLCTIEATISGDEEVCSGEEAMLTAAGGDTYLWSTGETTASITVDPTSTTSYSVVVSDSTVVDCSEELSITVNVTEKLIIGDFVWNDVNNNGLQDADEPGIDGVTVSLFDANDNLVAETVSANGGEYVFEVCPGEYYVVFGDFPTGFGVTTPNAGDDTLDSDADADGRTPMFEMTDTDNTTIDCGLVALCTINPAVSGDDLICSGEEAMLTATGGNTYLWSTGETTAAIEVSPTATTTYTVVVSDSTVTDCSEELTFTVTVQSVNIDAGPDVTIQFGTDATLTVSGAEASDTILWSTGETTTSIVVSPETSTTYGVTVVNALGCMAEDSVTVDVPNPCGIESAFKILPRDQPGSYTPGDETAACIGDNFYLWMFDPTIDVLGISNGQFYNDWKFTYEFPNGDVIVQDVGSGLFDGNHRINILDLDVEDFGEYNISWISPTGCEGSTVFTLNFPDSGCGANGRRASDFYSLDAIYPMPAFSGSEITLDISTRNQSFSSLSAKGASNAKASDFVSKKETIKLSLYNMNGSLMTAIQSFDVEEGKVKVYYQLGNLPTGNYIIKVDGDNWTDSKQIIVR